jgi:OOP family OmpA-OmpF porin
MKSTMKKAILATGLSSLMAAPVVLAEDHKFEISGGVGHQNFDNHRDLERAASYGLGLGYVIDPRWTVEAWWQDTKTDLEGASVDVDATEYRLDALYHFSKSGNWTPFVVAGVGDMTFDPEGSDDADETRVNLGVGVKNALTENLDFRGDVRLFNSLDDEETDMGLLLALTYKLGHAAKAMDSDGDGVLDAADACPNTPAGAAVNAQGCPLDTDGDGVFDYEDKCPGTAMNLKVDADGCPLELTENVSIALAVNFANNSAVVDSKYSAEIKRVADFLNQYTNAVVEIQGHTDSRGSAAYNQQLSQKRATAVAQALVNNHGVAADRVSAKGYGEENPIASNEAIEGRAANRRVVAEVSAQVKSMQQR